VIDEAGSAAALADDERKVRAHSLMLRYADQWVVIFEGWWKLSQNPVFAWMALSLLLNPARPSAPLPDWLREYLWRTSENILAITSLAKPPSASASIAQALGLVKEGKKIIEDAKLLLESPVIYGLYEHFKANATSRRLDRRGKSPAEWAQEEVQSLFKLQSRQVAEDRIREAKRTMCALFVVTRGRDPTDEVVSQECRASLTTALALTEIFGQNLSTDLQGLFSMPPPRREAIKAALKAKHLKP
jgi:hypothetical protein